MLLIPAPIPSHSEQREIRSMVLSTINPFSVKNIKKRLDLNNDGSIDAKDIKAVFSREESTQEQTLTPKEFVTARAKVAWSKLEPKLVYLSVQVQKRERVSRHWVRSRLPFGQDRRVNAIIEQLANLFSDRELNMLRTEYIAQVGKINKLENRLADTTASIAMQEESAKAKYEKLASKLSNSIDKESQRRDISLDSFRQRMNAYGVDLSNEQAEVLLSRIDSGDVTRMATIFAVISAMTRQFESAKQLSGENLSVTKKYYGIYIGLLELQIHIQSTYIDKIDQQYLPGVAKIGQEAVDLIAETKSKLKSNDGPHSEHYSQNIASQKFTLEVTEIYSAALRADRNNVAQAKAMVEKLHDLAQNTLSTVRVSADLTNLVRQAEGMYQEVMSLQTPALAPFENLQLKKEFEAVTSRLQSTP